MALLVPVVGYTLTQSWGPTTHVGEPSGYGYLGRFWWNPISGQPWFKFYRHYHPGLDMAAPEGTPILASESGTVTAAGWNGVSGLRYNVQIRPGVRYVGGHCRDLTVHLGQHVTKGQVIGHVGSTGGATGPHLHFGVLIEKPYNRTGYIYDPRLFFSGGANQNDPRIKPL
jgi:murein DD-endopeptidase MepM/ murein hydrolase activator NlpD